VHYLRTSPPPNAQVQAIPLKQVDLAKLYMWQQSRHGGAKDRGDEVLRAQLDLDRLDYKHDAEIQILRPPGPAGASGGGGGGEGNDGEARRETRDRKRNRSGSSGRRRRGDGDDRLEVELASQPSPAAARDGRSRSRTRRGGEQPAASHRSRSDVLRSPRGHAAHHDPQGLRSPRRDAAAAAAAGRSPSHRSAAAPPLPPVLDARGRSSSPPAAAATTSPSGAGRPAMPAASSRRRTALSPLPTVRTLPVPPEPAGAHPPPSMAPVRGGDRGYVYQRRRAGELSPTTANDTQDDLVSFDRHAVGIAHGSRQSSSEASSPREAIYRQTTGESDGNDDNSFNV
jgi:hypothetical protein